MKNQALFFSTDKSKKLKCRLLQFLFGALRVISALFAQTYPFNTKDFYGVVKPHPYPFTLVL